MPGNDLINDVSVPGGAANPLDGFYRFDGSARAFWSRFLELARDQAQAAAAYLFLKTNRGDEAAWKAHGRAPESGAAGLPRLAEPLDTVLERAAQPEPQLESSAGRRPTTIAVFALDTGAGPRTSPARLVLVYPETDIDTVRPLLGKVALLADRPAIFQQARTLRQAWEERETLTRVLDLMLLLNREERFLPSALTTCNELVDRIRAERVSLGWHHNSQVRLQAMSHAEKFEHKMELVRLMELAMEETVDQDEVVAWPLAESSPLVDRDHAQYAGESGVRYLCSVPLRARGEVQAVLFFERSDAPFSADEQLRMELYADQLGPVLADRREQDRWWGGRFYHGLRRRAAKLVGVRHTGWKLAGGLAAIALGVLLFGHMDYRLEAPFTLKSGNVRFVTAPFDGYLDKVMVEVGDRVEKSDLLCRFDTQELLLDKAETGADYTKLVRDMERRRAEGELAEMRIMQAQAEQVKARLERIDYRLEQAAVEAAFTGVVVSGDLREQEGSRFQTGDELFRLARLDTLFAEAQLEEAAIDELPAGTTGYLRFKSRPAQTFPITVQRVEPVAQTEEAGNVFAVRLHLPDGRPAWWRPGMSGVAHLDAGERNILWILTHRTMDYLRMNVFWW